MKTSYISINKKMDAYGLLMALSVALEINFSTSRGDFVSFLYYAITVIRFLICRYMVSSLQDEIGMGFDYKACKRAFDILSRVLVVDFLLSFMLLTYYWNPSKESLKALVLIVAVIYITEFILSTMAYRYFIPRSKFNEMNFKLALGWVIVNAIVVLLMVINVKELYVSHYGIEHKWRVFLFLAFLVREIFKYSISHNYKWFDYHHYKYIRR